MPEKDKKTVALRQLAMLGLIPRYPRKTSVPEIRRRFDEQGFSVTERTIQRDLESLRRSGLFEIDYDDPAAKPIGWFWKERAPKIEFPSMDPQTALTLNLAARHLRPLLPVSTTRYLEPYFEAADGILRGLNNKVMKWPDKVRVVPRSQPLLPPKVDPSAQTAVYQGLLEERRLKVLYQRRGEKEAKPMTVNPLALVIRDSVIYLVCTLWNYRDVFHLPLHRVKSAEVLDQACTVPEGFRMDEYIQGGEFGYPVDDGPPKMVKLQMLMNRGVAEHLHETPLSDDQAITDHDEDDVRVTATVLHTQQLEWWLLGFGDYVVVEKPAKLRAAIKERIDNLAEWYA